MTDVCEAIIASGKNRGQKCNRIAKHSIASKLYCGIHFRSKEKLYCSTCDHHFTKIKSKLKHLRTKKHMMAMVNGKQITKEGEVANFVVSNFPNLNWIINKRIRGGKSKKRPDIFTDLGNHCLIIEVDENQHKCYDEKCESSRLLSLSSDLNHKNMIVIRFNPDRYDKIKSPWQKDDKGRLSIIDSKEWNSRLDRLGKIVDHHRIDYKKNKLIHIERLYFDQ